MSAVEITMQRKVLVPIKPTAKMLQAAADTGCFVVGDEDAREWIWKDNAEIVWRAMLAAAPAPQARPLEDK